MTRRRTLLYTLLGSAMVICTAPFTVAAQQAGRIYRIGLLVPVPAAAATHNIDALREELRKLGWLEGQNLVIETRSAEGHYDRFPRLASELLNLNIDVFVTWGTPAARAARHATTSIPIVMAATGDLTGLVTNLARPEGNVTGLTPIPLETEGKRLELLLQALPNASRVAAIWNPSNPYAVQAIKQVQRTADALKVKLVSATVRTPNDLDSAFAKIAEERADAIYILPEPVLLLYQARVLELVSTSRLPTMYGYREFVDAGGFMFYGPSWPALFRRGAHYVDKILKGAKPADLPVEQPTKFDLVLNLKTAKALGVTIPASLLLRADEVIQ